MALLSIAEPGQSQAPHQHRFAIGIDLGTTNSLVAAVRDGSPTVLRDADGLKLLPSVVRYSADNAAVVGYDAKERQARDPFNTLSSVKRLMGRGYDDLTPEQHLQYRFVERAAGMIRLDTVAGPRTPIEVSADILKVLRSQAEQTLGGELVGAVITVPAYFDDAQRQATKDAARLAGINVLRLLNEPTAAAVAYGLERAGEGVFAVYDLGGGTFDISILRLSRGIFEVLAVNGDSALGGDDFDHKIFEWIVAQAGYPILHEQDRPLLLQQARKAKECLSSQEEADIFARMQNGTVLNLTLTRKIFDALTADLVAKTLTPVRKALRDAQVTVDDVKGMVLVGGATRIPAVRRTVARLFGREPLTDVDPDEAVALGAAVQANQLAGNRNAQGDWLLLDVIPLSLGLETMGGLVERVIPRNSTLPVARAQDFTTFKDGQTAMNIHVVQGERERVSDCRSLARFELRGIPPMAAGAARIRVTFQVDADGLLNVSAREQSTGVESHVAVKPSYGLSDAEIAAMLRDSQVNADSDAHARMLREQLVDAERLIDSIQSAVRNDGDTWLSAGERDDLDASIASLCAAMQSNDTDRIRQEAEALNRLTVPLAARRMDKAIRSAFTGRTLSEIG